MPTTTFTYTAGQGARMATAYGKYLGLGRDATSAEIKAEMWNQQRILVAAQEKATAETAALVTANAGLTDLGVVT